MFENTAFPFHTTSEAWDYFTKSARVHFAKLVRQEIETNDNIRKQLKVVRHKDYCARLMYILNMFAYEGDQDGEFDIDWAMIMANPSSAKQARQSLRDLIDLGLMGEKKTDEKRRSTMEATEARWKLGGTDSAPDRDGARKRTPPTGAGGKTNRKTKFDFDA